MAPTTESTEMGTMKIRILALAAGLFSGVAITQGATPSFDGIGVNAFVYEVANNGERVVGRDSSGRAAYWTASSGWTHLGFGGFAYGVSGDGSAVVGWSGSSTNSSPGGNSAFRWTRSAGVEWIENLAGTTSNTVAMAISSDGSTVVGNTISPSGYKESYRWTPAGGMISLRSDLGNPEATRVAGVSGDGSRIAGTYEISFATLSGNWLWNSDGTVNDMREVPVHSSGSISPWGVSADGGTVVGGGGIWREDTGLEPLGRLPEVDGGVEARDVSGDGRVATGYAYLSGKQTAVMWDISNEMLVLKDIFEDEHGLDLSGWSLRWAHVSDDGKTFAGVGKNPDGYSEAWLATVPEPATMGMLALGGLAVLRRRRRK